jgi:ABC-type nitrate/sulfonate/bicarbonate transport system ATPase subunit
MVAEDGVLAQVVLRFPDMTSAAELTEPGVTRAADRTGSPAISFQHVCKQFPGADGGTLEVLRDVGFGVPAGDIVAIVGPSGSGKSTLLNMAAGLLMPDQGQVVVMGQPTIGAVDWSRVGYMFQDDRLLPWRVALGNVALALEAGSMPVAERTRRAGAVLDLVGLGGFAKSYPHQLSGGMRSRVALARSLVGEPDLLLMDEPFSRLDAQTRGSMHRELLRIHAMRRISILFVTHDVEEAVVLADHVVLMSARPGRVRRTIDVALPQPRTATADAIALANELRASLEAEPTPETST